MKLFRTNKDTESLAVTIPKKLYVCLGWQKGDKVEATLGKDRSIVIRKVEDKW